MNVFIDKLSRNLDFTIKESRTSNGFESSYYCNDQGYVEGLKLYQTGIKSLEALEPIASNLKVLTISEPCIENIEQISKFTQLEELDLILESLSSLKGLEKLGRLKKLNVCCEEISTVKEIELLDSLEQLKLYCPYPPPDIIDLRALKSLDLLQLSGVESIGMIRGIENLKTFELKNNDISEISGMEKCPNLEQLSLFSNPITKIQGVNELKQLISFDIGSTRISRIEGLVGLENLERLSLGHNSINRIEGLETVVNLKELDLTNYLGESLSPLTEIQGIEHLNKLENLILTGQRIVELKNIPVENLRLLDVSWNNIGRIDYDWLKSLQRACVISLEGNPIKVNFDEVPDHVTINC